MSAFKNILKQSLRVVICATFTCILVLSCAIYSNALDMSHESSSNDSCLSEFEEQELFNKSDSVIPEILKLNNVYLDASLIYNYDKAEYIEAGESCQLVLFDDSIAIIPFSRDRLKSSICLYSLSKSIKDTINSLTEKITSVEKPLLKSFTIPYKFYGCMTIYSHFQQEASEADKLGELVDTLYTILCKLPCEFETIKPSNLYQNRILEICPINTEDRCGIRESKSNITAKYGSDMICVEGDSISYYDLRRRKQSAKLSNIDKEVMLSLFNESGILFDNIINPNVNYVSANLYSVFINGKVYFLHMFPNSKSINLSDIDPAIIDRYIIDMYELYKIAQKYFPNLHENFTLKDNGMTLRYY